MHKNKPNLISLLEIHFVVIIFGFTAILGKLISVSAQEVVFYRTLLASIGLFILLTFIKKPIRIEKKEATKMIITGLFVAIHWLLFFGAARISNVSISLVGLATSTLWVALIQPFVDKTKISILEICLGLVVIFGLFLIFQTELDNWLGLLCSIGSALFAAIFSIINSKFTQKHHSLVITFYEMIGACVFTLISIFVYGFMDGNSKPFNTLPTENDWFWLFILAAICSIYAYSAIVRLLQFLTTFSVNLVINLEPIYGIILAYFIFGESEKMEFGFYAGTTIICLAVFGYQVYARKAKV